MADNTLIEEVNHLKRVKKGGIILAIAGIVVIGGTGIYVSQMSSQKASTSLKVESTPTPTINAVTALGRLEPQTVIQLSAPTSIGGSALIEQLGVKEGDKVNQGQVIAVLDNWRRLKAAVNKSQEDVRVAEANLNKVKSGAKEGEIVAQEAKIAELRAQLAGVKSTSQATLARLQAQAEWEPLAQQNNVQALTAQLSTTKPSYTAKVGQLEADLARTKTEFDSYQMLYKNQAIDRNRLITKGQELQRINQQIVEAKANYQQQVAVLTQQINQNKATYNKLKSVNLQTLKEAAANYQQQVATIEQQIQQAEANLARIKEVRPVDIKEAEAQLNRAIATYKQAQADLETAYVRAPFSGEVIKINAREGESPVNKGIISLGNTNNMVAVAEVYETDINKVKVGQSATFTSESGAFTGEIKGQIIEVGRQIGKKDVLATDPAADADSRVVEVKIAVDPNDNNKISGFTYSKVIIKINI